MIKEATLHRKLNTSLAGRGNEAWNVSACSTMLLQFLMLISYITGPNFQFRCKRGSAPGRRMMLGVAISLNCGDFHLVVAEVVPVCGSAEFFFIVFLI